MSSRASHQLFSNKYCLHFRPLAERSSHITVCLHGELSALLRGHWESCSTYRALCRDTRPPCWILESFADPGKGRRTVYQKNAGYGHGRGMWAWILQMQILITVFKKKPFSSDRLIKELNFKFRRINHDFWHQSEGARRPLTRFPEYPRSLPKIFEKNPKLIQKDPYHRTKTQRRKKEKNLASAVQKCC